MIKHTAIILSIIFCCSFIPTRLATTKSGQTGKTTKTVSTILTENIRLDFTAKFINDNRKTIEINATLFNDRLDTAYFLSTTCDGTQYSLQYDTSKFYSSPKYVCNASFPCIVKIAPKGQFDFQAYFTYKMKVTRIKMGFDFYEVDKSFDLNKVEHAPIHVRDEEVKNIVWAQDKTIE